MITGLSGSPNGPLNRVHTYSILLSTPLSIQYLHSSPKGPYKWSDAFPIPIISAFSWIPWMPNGAGALPVPSAQHRQSLQSSNSERARATSIGPWPHCSCAWPFAIVEAKTSRQHSRCRCLITAEWVHRSFWVFDDKEVVSLYTHIYIYILFLFLERER